jgi:hypothetical protein
VVFSIRLVPWFCVGNSILVELMLICFYYLDGWYLMSIGVD